MKTAFKIVGVILSVVLFMILLYACSKEDPTPIPSIATKDVGSITLSSAVSGGEMSELSPAITAKGICWSKNQNPTTSDSKAADNSENKSFSANITSLSANTVYYVRAFATNGTGTGYGDQISFTTLTDYSGQSGSVSDIDGNSYPTIGIGSQIWMARNLATSKYSDGTSIPLVTSDGAWPTTTIGYCFYDNDPGKKATYGALYNWFTLDAAYNSNKNVCPDGWHIPSRTEFLTLTGYLGPDAAYKLNESGTSHWFAGNTSTNETGFTALPGGVRNDTNGGFQFMRDEGYLWSSTPSVAGSNAYRMSFHETYVDVTYLGSKGIGMSVRCLKN